VWGALIHPELGRHMTDVIKIDACIQSSPYPAWLATSQGKCLYGNPELERLIGLDSDEIRQADWCSFILEADQVVASESWQKSLASGIPYRTTVRLRGFDGVPETVELIAFGHTSNEGLDVWLFTGLYAHGVTQQSLCLEAQLQATLNVIPVYTWYALPSGALAFVNERTGDYLGLPKDHPLRFGIDIGAEWDAHIPFLHPDDREESRRVWSACVRTGSPSENSFRVRSAQGEYRWFLSRVEALRATDGTLLYWIGVNLDIDERKRAEERLQERERELVAIIQTVPSMLWSMSPAGEVTHISERCLEYSGASLEEIVTHGWLRFIHPDDRNVTARAFFQAIETGESYSVIYRLRRAEGDYRWHHARAEPMRDAHGKIIQWYGLLNDIDEQKRAEDDIRFSERELRALVETIPAFVGTALPDGSCDFLSESWLDYMGFTEEQGLGWGWANSIHPEDVGRVVANWRAGLAAGQTVEQELRCRNGNGTYHWFLNRNCPLRDNEGNIIKWYGTLTNIDALKETERALQIREHELLGIIETIPSMLWSLWPNGEPNHLSQRFLEYFDVPLEEIASRGWENYVHPDDREESSKAFFRAIKTGEPYNIINRLRRADGEYRWHQSRGEPLRDPHGKIIRWYGLAIDIDERKRAEDHLRDTHLKLAKASGLATVAELAGSIAHELNQPLMSILANAQAAKRWLNSEQPTIAEANSAIERTIRDARAADETMQHIRALFKRESFNKKDADIPKILREVVRVVQEDPKKRNVPIECNFEEPLPTVHVDRIQIQQVFINLITNAIEALEGQQSAWLIELRAVTDSNRMLVQVIDNGPGVDNPDEIFDAFITTKEKGMGIGLAVSRSIVEAHGGQLWAENNQSGGATFNVALPLSHASSPEA
jgi:PAS domain S-box-containing protein